MTRVYETFWNFITTVSLILTARLVETMKHFEMKIASLIEIQYLIYQEGLKTDWSFKLSIIM